MGKYSLLRLPAECLLRKSQPLSFPLDSQARSDISFATHCFRKTFQELQIHTLGLSAPQVGINSRFFLTMKSMATYGKLNLKGTYTRSFNVHINPEILEASQQQADSYENCLSVDDNMYILQRHKWVHVRYWTTEGNQIEAKMFGLPGFVFQHELDHLNGLLIADRGKKVDSLPEGFVQDIRVFREDNKPN